MDQRPGYGDALLLSAGQTVGKAPGTVFQADSLKQAARPVARRRPCPAVEFQRQEQVFFDRQGRNQIKKLEDKADMRRAGIRCARVR